MKKQLKTSLPILKLILPFIVGLVLGVSVNTISEFVKAEIRKHNLVYKLSESEEKEGEYTIEFSNSGGRLDQWVEFKAVFAGKIKKVVWSEGLFEENMIEECNNDDNDFKYYLRFKDIDRGGRIKFQIWTKDKILNLPIVRSNARNIPLYECKFLPRCGNWLRSPQIITEYWR